MTLKKEIKKSLKKIILENKRNIYKLEKIIHPLVRKKMRSFTSQYRNKRLLFYEIPLLIESKLMKYFNTVIFIKAQKKIRLKRFKNKGGNEKLFNILNSKQLSSKKKSKFSDYIVVNEKNLNILKKNLLGIMTTYV